MIIILLIASRAPEGAMGRAGKADKKVGKDIVTYPQQINQILFNNRILCITFLLRKFCYQQLLLQPSWKA